MRGLSNALYSTPTAEVFFYPFIDQNDPYSGMHRGINCGDLDSASITVTQDKKVRAAKNLPIIADVLSVPRKTTVELKIRAMQFTPEFRAASMMGKVGVHSQAAAAGITKDFGDTTPGVYKLNDFAVENVTATKGGAPAILGTDFEFDGASGQIQTFVAMEDFIVTYDRKAIAASFVSGIGSSSGLRGMFLIRGVNQDGVKSMHVLRDVTLSADGARQLIAEGDDFAGIDLVGLCAPMSGPDIDPELAFGYEKEITD